MKTLQYPGSKKRIAKWHHSYLEPYFGGGAVLFEKEPSRIETINDIDGEVVNLFRVIRENKEELIQKVVFTPYCREEYDTAFWKEESADPVEKARRFLIRSMQGFGFKTCEKTGWKKDVYGREAAYAVRYWNDLPETIKQMALRLKMVQIENKPAIDLIKSFNHSNVLIYADPPYVLSTRDRKQYNFEMTDEDHIELLETLLQHKGPVMLSGYDNEIYNKYLAGWRKTQIEARTQSNSRRTETLWMNFQSA